MNTCFVFSRICSCEHYVCQFNVVRLDSERLDPLFYAKLKRAKNYAKTYICGSPERSGGSGPD